MPEALVAGVVGRNSLPGPGASVSTLERRLLPALCRLCSVASRGSASTACLRSSVLQRLEPKVHVMMSQQAQQAQAYEDDGAVALAGKPISRVLLRLGHVGCPVCRLTRRHAGDA
jgi:hypothetical protein